MRREGERRPGIEARKNHLYFLFIKLSDEVEALMRTSLCMKEGGAGIICPCGMYNCSTGIVAN